MNDCVGAFVVPKAYVYTWSVSSKSHIGASPVRPTTNLPPVMSRCDWSASLSGTISAKLDLVTVSAACQKLIVLIGKRQSCNEALRGGPPAEMKAAKRFVLCQGLAGNRHVRWPSSEEGMATRCMWRRDVGQLKDPPTSLQNEDHTEKKNLSFIPPKRCRFDIFLVTFPPRRWSTAGPLTLVACGRSPSQAQEYI